MDFIEVPMRKKILSTVIFLSLCLLFVALKNIQYKPTEAMSVSDDFLNRIATNKLDQAYALTNENAIVGTTFDQFQTNVRREWWIRDNSNCDFEIKSIFPEQSYGNRLRRYLKNGKHIEPALLIFGYEPCGDFQILLRQNRNGQWKVVNFQRRAG
ncbi:hypothetical protein LEP1GSC168_0473 [Leptospira santarosai str. HAI134]|nr:hypothetical protein LEP1GSC168_0473 [Leptospira santarosai str. HAI134]